MELSDIVRAITRTAEYSGVIHRNVGLHDVDYLIFAPNGEDKVEIKTDVGNIKIRRERWMLVGDVYIY